MGDLQFSDLYDVTRPRSAMVVVSFYCFCSLITYLFDNSSSSSSLPFYLSQRSLVPFYYFYLIPNQNPFQTVAAAAPVILTVQLRIFNDLLIGFYQEKFISRLLR